LVSILSFVFKESKLETVKFSPYRGGNRISVASITESRPILT